MAIYVLEKYTYVLYLLYKGMCIIKYHFVMSIISEFEKVSFANFFVEKIIP